MKKILTLTLSALMLASAFTACAPAIVEKPASSADGVAKYTAFLEERLDKMPDELTVATAETADSYGVDMSAFAADGYLIRAESGEVLILGKTDAGLDRAVRDYVKNGNDQDYFKVFGEGYRVKRLTIAGNDISEYAILRDDTADECHTYASSELVGYIERTCGAVLPRYTVSEYAAATDKPERTILITVDYPTLGDENFRIEIGDDGNMTVSGGRYRGCLYGVYGLLYNMGWRFIGSVGYDSYFTNVTGTSEYLYESDHVDLTADINRTESAAIPDRITRTNNLKLFDNYATNNNYKLGGYGILDGMSHGFEVYHNDIFSGEYEDLYLGLEEEGKQPCYTNEDIYEAVEAWAFRRMAYLVSVYPGIEDCPAIDVSHWDASEDTFCACKTCLKVQKEEKSLCGSVLRLANRLADSLNTEYEGAKVHILAYAGLEKLPEKTKPSEHIVVAYCYYVRRFGSTCHNHCVSGVDCNPSSEINNVIYAEWFEEWVEVCAPGNIIVWYYPATCYPVAFHSPFYTVIRDDMKYFSEQGIELLYVCANFCNSGITNDQLAAYLCAKFSWNCDYTDEEMYAIIEEWLSIVYGDAGYYIYEYLMLCERAADLTGCWIGFKSNTTDKVNNEFMAEYFDHMYSQFEKAHAAADTAVIEELVERCKAGMLYMCIGVTYEDRYVNGTEKERAIIAERYTEMYELFNKYRIPVYDSLSSPEYFTGELDLDRNPMEYWTMTDGRW